MSAYPSFILLGRNKQHGATLIIVLVFLTALTLLGATAAQNSSLEERMASNTNNRDIAFQAAEAALKYVQLNLSTGANIRTQDYSGSTAGYRTYDPLIADNATYWGTTFIWSGTTARTLADAIDGVASQPLYVVEKMPSYTTTVAPITTTEFYRVTARGVGADANAVVILQAAYSYTTP